MGRIQTASLSRFEGVQEDVGSVVSPARECIKGKPKWNPNSEANGIQLPKTKKARRNVNASKNMPLHSGSHPKYTASVQKLAKAELDKLTAKYGKPSKIPPAELTKAASRVQKAAKKLLEGWSGDTLN